MGSMGTPIDLGRLFGVQIRVELSVLLVAAILVVTGVGKNPSLQNVLDQTTFVVLLLFSIFLHEMGHAFGAWLFKIRTLDVTLTFFGGYARLDPPPRGALQDIVVSFAGPATNLLIAGVLYFYLSSDAGQAQSEHTFSILARVQGANLVLGILNLLPGYPLDGGHIARAFLALFLPNTTARLIVGYIGVVVGFIFIGLDLSGGFGFGLLIGLLLVYVASVEIQAARSSRF
jgi:Zn-dependent protease